MKHVAALIITLAVAAPALAQRPNNPGNGAPSGGHYNLNLIGHTDCLGNDFIGSNRHVIAVLLNYDDGNQNGTHKSNLNKKNKIFLQPGDAFKVLDGSACDGAYFQMPTDVSNTYEVFVKAGGSPQGNPSATITACSIDPDGNIVCETTDNVIVMRSRGQDKFTNVTSKLLQVCIDTDPSDGVSTCDQKVDLFHNSLYEYFWDYDNRGLRLAQLRFYPVD